jgi:soluble lytic murein transglycosylase-like protein
MVLATIEHESGGSPTAVSYYRKSKAPYNDPAMPAEVKNGPREAIRDWMYANWSGHAYGLGQLIPETGAKYGGIVGAKYGRRKGGFPGDSFNPEKNIKGTVAFLDELMRKYSGDKRSVYAAYYAGAGNVKKRGREHYKKYIEASLNREATYHAFDQ